MNTTRPPSWYLPPGQEEIKKVAGQVGLKTYAPSLLADLANIAAGGEILSRAEIEPALMEEAQRRASKTSVGNGELLFPMSKGGWTKTRQEAVESWTTSLASYQSRLADFLRSAPLERLPGQSPLEQAAHCLKLLAKMPGGQGGGGSDESPLPIFSEEKMTGGELGQLLDEVISDAESLSEEEKEMLDAGQDTEKSPEGDGSRSPGKTSLRSLAIAEKLLPGQDERVLLEISRKLDAMSPFRVRRSRKAEPDQSARQIRYRPLTKLSELAKVPAALAKYKTGKAARRLALYQAVSGQLLVPERIRYQEKKQLLLILVDCSGSMKGGKHLRASGVVMNRLKAVLSGDAEVWLGLFDSRLHTPMRRAATPEEAKRLMERFRRENFSGGSTDIACAVREAVKEAEVAMQENPALERPEILVLTDEDTSVSNLSKADCPGWVVHGFAMEVANPGLMKFVKSTGGVGLEKF